MLLDVPHPAQNPTTPSQTLSNTMAPADSKIIPRLGFCLGTYQLATSHIHTEHRWVSVPFSDRPPSQLCFVLYFSVLPTSHLMLTKNSQCEYFRRMLGLLTSIPCSQGTREQFLCETNPKRHVHCCGSPSPYLAHLQKSRK